jgi:hypothetical protein
MRIEVTLLYKFALFVLAALGVSLYAEVNVTFDRPDPCGMTMNFYKNKLLSETAGH